VLDDDDDDDDDDGGDGQRTELVVGVHTHMSIT
jgi:hypothetical protein